MREVVHGDFRNKLDKAHAQFGISAVIVDPPYGISHRSHGQNFKDAIPIKGDGDTGIAEWIYWWCQSEQVPLAMFFSPYTPIPNCKFRSILCWSKGGHTGGGGDRKTCWKRDFEMVGIAFNRELNGERDSGVLEYNSTRGKISSHFCEKPVPLMAYLVKKLTLPGGLVVDPCCGGGSTGVASVMLGRKFYGIEIDKHWADIARNRVHRAHRQRTFL